MNIQKLILISLLIMGIVSTIIGMICTRSNIFPLGLILLIGGGFLILIFGRWLIDDWAYGTHRKTKLNKDWNEYTKKEKILVIIFAIVFIIIAIIAVDKIKDVIDVLFNQFWN